MTSCVSMTTLSEKVENSKGQSNPEINKQYYGIKEKDKWPNNDIHVQSTIHTIQLQSKQHEPIYKKNGDELGCFGRVSSHCSTCDTRRVTLTTNLMITYE